jgi:hypothetical protein
MAVEYQTEILVVYLHFGIPTARKHGCKNIELENGFLGEGLIMPFYIPLGALFLHLKVSSFLKMKD